MSYLSLPALSFVQRTIKDVMGRYQKSGGGGVRADGAKDTDGQKDDRLS